MVLASGIDPLYWLVVLTHGIGLEKSINIDEYHCNRHDEIEYYCIGQAWLVWRNSFLKE